MNDRRLPTLLCALMLVTLAPLAHDTHRAVDAWQPRQDITDRVMLLPSGDTASVACLGHDAMLADLLWIRAVLFFGRHHGVTLDAGWTTYLYYMVDLVTDLDPHFVAPYKYGGLMLRLESDWVDASSMLMAKGMRHNPDQWYFPFTISMNYFFRDDLERAAEFAQIAARSPDAPFYLANLAATMLNDSNREEVALRFLEEEYKSAVDDERKTAIYVKIHETRFEMARKEVEAARQQYVEEMGRPPHTIEELVPTWLPSIPGDPYQVFVDDPSRCGLIIDPLDQSVSSACLIDALRNIRSRYDIGAVR